ncbi:MAG: LysM peptidoglycan-binding domain-containing protein, partial [Gammaproteobacteria bacterium]|nr:LysM peptidoglycan-binding domain-containing protein [Gammaproteobacteria bacterium]
RNDEATSDLEKLDAVKPTPVTENTDSVDSPVDNIAEGADKHTINKTESEDEAPPNIASSQEAEESTLKSDDKNSQYSARIKPDDNGVTIEINAPEEEPVLQNTTPDNENQTQESQETTAGDDISHKVTESEPGIKITVKQENSNKSAKEVVHIVVKGDTLWAIAKHYVNNPYQYPELARLSNIKNPDRIYPGNRVRIIHKPSDSKR